MMISENEKEKKIDTLRIKIGDHLESLLDMKFQDIDKVSEKE